MDYYKSEYRPLEYYEVQMGKPLVLEIAPKWREVLNLWVIKKFLYFNDTYKYIFKKIEYVNGSDLPKKDIYKVAYFNELITLLYDITKDNYKGYWKQKKYKKKLRECLLNDLNKLVGIYTHILDYNSDIKKKLEILQNYNIWQSNAFLMIGGEPLSKYTRTNEKGEKYMIPRFSLN